LTLSGYCANNVCPASFIRTSQDPGIFSVMIKELAGETLLSSVPVIASVDTDIFVSSSQIPL